MKSATISLAFSLFAFQGANAAVTLVLPFATSIPARSSFSLPSGVSIPSVSLPSGVTLPSGFSIPSISIPSVTIPPSTPTASRSSISFTAFATVSVGGIESSDGATTYFLQEIEGVNGVTSTLTGTQTIVQGATVWRADSLHETCSLDGKGGALCVLGAGEFKTSFTGSTFPIFTVGAGAGGSGGGSGGSSGSGGGSNGSGGSAPSGGAARVNGGASVGWMLVGTVAALVAGMKLML